MTMHTPTPWGYTGSRDQFLNVRYNKPIGIYTDDATFHIGDLLLSATDEINHENLKLIVRAVNSHDALVAALQDLADTVDSALDTGLLLSVDGKRPDLMTLQHARAALAKASA